MRSLIVAAVAAVAATTHGNTSVTKPATHEVEIVGTDYAFKVPRELPAGATTFRFHNAGKKRHEFNIFMLKPGVNVSQVIELQKAGKSTQALVEGPVGVLFAEPGSRSPSNVSTDLIAGRVYGVICIFRDTTTAPRHYEMGMYSSIKVLPSKKARTAPLRADTIVGVDYAYRYSSELSPGRHTFVFRNEGKVRHEVSVTLLKPGVTLAKIVEIDKAGGDIDPLIDQGMGLLWARAGEIPFGRLEVNLLPGREYMIDCGFSDDDKSPPHYTLGMYGSIHVAQK